MPGLRKRAGQAAPEPGRSSPFGIRTGLKLASTGSGGASATLRVQRDGPNEAASVDSETITTLVHAAAAAAVGGRSGRGELSDVYITFVQPAAEHPLTAEAQVVGESNQLPSC